MAVAVSTVISGTARVGKRTKELVRCLLPGEIAVIDHPNLDRVAAQELVAARPAAVVNASPSADGTHPNLGPLHIGAPKRPCVVGRFKLASRKAAPMTWHRFFDILVTTLAIGCLIGVTAGTVLFHI